MPAVSDITINDGTVPTPVARLFIPIDINAGVVSYENQAGLNPLGFARMTTSLTRPKGGVNGTSSKDRNSRLKIQIHLPRLETLGNGANGLIPSPVIAYKPVVEISAILPERSTELDRLDLLAFARNALAVPNVVAMFAKLQTTY